MVHIGAHDHGSLAGQPAPFLKLTHRPVIEGDNADAQILRHAF